MFFVTNKKSKRISATTSSDNKSNTNVSVNFIILISLDAEILHYKVNQLPSFKNCLGNILHLASKKYAATSTGLHVHLISF